MYARAGAHDRAVFMFRDLRMFAEADAFEKKYAKDAAQQEDGRLLAGISAHMQVQLWQRFDCHCFVDIKMRGPTCWRCLTKNFPSSRGPGADGNVAGLV